jgi:fatty acid desaturase
MEQLKLPAREDFPPELSQVSAIRALGMIAFDWGLIFGSISLAVAYPNVLTFVAAQLIVASRQHALFLIMHEATHYLLTKNRKWNDRISNYLAAWPVGFSTERYRLRHWHHHRYLNTDRDPDWFRKKADPTWQFPMTRWGYWRACLPHLLGKGVREMTYAFLGLGITRADLPRAVPYFGAIALAITYFGAWKIFALYWLLPYFTVLPFLHRIRNATDHLALPKTHLLNGTRNVVGSLLGGFFFAPHGGSLHLVHHIYPFVPCYRLEDAHVFLLLNDSFREHAHENGGYFFGPGRSVYQDMTRKGEEALVASPSRRAA